MTAVNGHMLLEMIINQFRISRDGLPDHGPILEFDRVYQQFIAGTDREVGRATRAAVEWRRSEDGDLIALCALKDRFHLADVQ